MGGSCPTNIQCFQCPCLHHIFFYLDYKLHTSPVNLSWTTNRNGCAISVQLFSTRFPSRCFAVHVTEIFSVQAHMFIGRGPLCLLICRCLFVLWKRVCLLLRGCDITCLSGKTLTQMAADEWNNWGRMHTLRLLQTDKHATHTHTHTPAG